MGRSGSLLLHGGDVRFWPPHSAMSQASTAVETSLQNDTKALVSHAGPSKLESWVKMDSLRLASGLKCVGISVAYDSESAQQGHAADLVDLPRSSLRSSN